MKDLDPADALGHMLQEKDVETWFDIHLAADDAVAGTDHSSMDEQERYYRVIATAKRATVNPLARRHLYVSLLEYITGDKHDPTDRERRRSSTAFGHC